VSIEPTQAQFERLAASAEVQDGAVIMINLLRFKERADGIDAADGISGAEAYARYGASAQEFLDGVGGRVLLAVDADESVIGPQDGEWDMVLAVEYPSRRAFLEMISDRGYLEIHGHRAAALADSRLIACTPVLGRTNGDGRRHRAQIRIPCAGTADPV
jgi:uncharacterized protein (DUF1330 family)